jgi:hypothetical protein
MMRDAHDETPRAFGPTARLLQLWRQRDRDQAWLAWLGLALVASGLLHVVVQLVLGGPLTGPVSWRKPITFGLSGGLTTLSLAWVVGALPATRGRAAWVRIYVVTMALEVALITMQAWRGVASHFNDATALDAAIFTVMGLLIAVASAAMVRWAWQSWRRPVDDMAEHRARAHGMLILIGSLAVGLWMSAHGSMVTAGVIEAPAPSVYGAAGLMKLPHAVGLHALQVLPLLALLLRHAGLPAARRARAVLLASRGYGLLFLAALGQTLAGRLPWDLTPAMLAIVLAAIVMVGLPFAQALLARASNPTLARQGA